MTAAFLSHDAAVAALDWEGAIEAIRAGHLRPRPDSGDLLLGKAGASLLNRAAAIEGLGFAVKAETIFEGNAGRGLPSVQGAVLLFDSADGAVRAIIESRLVTQYKTVADSLLGARLLARPDSGHLLIVGAGAIAGPLVRGYAASFPGLRRISIWARRPEQASTLAGTLADLAIPVGMARDLEPAVRDAEIIATATMARAPLVLGDWVAPGSHVDLIGAFTPEMRESDDRLIARARVFVDCLDTTVGCIGDLMAPVASGAVTPAHVLGDLYDLIPMGGSARRNADEITVFKNGGGAHLDLMIADYIANANGIRPQP